MKKKKKSFTDPAACACSTARGLCRRGCDRKESGKKQAEGRRGKKIYVTDLGKSFLRFSLTWEMEKSSL